MGALTSRPVRLSRRCRHPSAHPPGAHGPGYHAHHAAWAQLATPFLAWVLCGGGLALWPTAHPEAQLSAAPTTMPRQPSSETPRDSNESSSRHTPPPPGGGATPGTPAGAVGTMSPPETSPPAQSGTPEGSGGAVAYEALRRGCDRTLPCAGENWGSPVAKAIMAQARPVVDIPGLRRSVNHAHMCSACRSGKQPMPQRAATPAGNPPPLDAATVAGLLARSRPLVPVKGGPALTRSGARSARSLAMWSAKFELVAAGPTDTPRLPASALAFGVEPALKAAILRRLHLSFRGVETVETMTMKDFRSLIREAAPITDERIQVTEWFDTIRCAGSSDDMVGNYVLEYQTFLSAHPRHIPPAGEGAHAAHARMCLNNRFVLGLPRSPLRGKLRSDPDSWQGLSWAKMLEHVAEVPRVIAGERDDGPHRGARLFSMESRVNSAHSETPDPAAATLESQGPEATSFPTQPTSLQVDYNSDAAQAHLCRLSQARLGKPELRNCLHCKNADTKHTFDTCPVVRKLSADPSRKLCRHCWALGAWGSRTHLQAECRNGGKQSASAAAGPAPQFSVPRRPLQHIATALPELGSGAPEAEKQLHARLHALQQSLSVEGLAPSDSPSE